MPARIEIAAVKKEPKVAIEEKTAEELSNKLKVL
jgi:hypothetical protein